jgi:hypothetical protein
MRHVQKVSCNRTYWPHRWHEQGAPARLCLRSREGYIRHIVSSHSLFISVILSWNECESKKSRQLWDTVSDKNLNAKNVGPSEIYWQVCEVYGDNAMSDGMVRRWCRMFSEGRTNVHDDDRSGRPSLVTVNLLDQVNEKIRENRRFTFFST